MFQSPALPAVWRHLEEVCSSCLEQTDLMIHCQGKYVLVLVTVTVSVFPVHRSTTSVFPAKILVSSL